MRRIPVLFMTLAVVALFGACSGDGGDGSTLDSGGGVLSNGGCVVSSRPTGGTDRRHGGRFGGPCGI